jgi:hypothetical protein
LLLVMLCAMDVLCVIFFEVAGNNFHSHADITPFSEPWPPRGFSPFFFSNRAQASKHSGTKTSSSFPPLADQ